MAQTPVGPGSWEHSQQAPLDISGIQCEFGHANPQGATYCGTCGVGLLSPPDEGSTRPKTDAKDRSLTGRIRGAFGRLSGNSVR
jgi:hypothetical protein